jgi:hypothetical protein
VANTVTINNVVNFASTHVELMPIASVGGYTNEPALSLANDTLQELCSAPTAWKFNRVTSNIMVTQAGRQEQLFAGACAFVSDLGGVGIGLASDSAITETGNTVTVTTLQPHNFTVGKTVYMLGNTVAAYNSAYAQTLSSSGWSGGWTITAVPTTTSFQFTHATSGLAASGAAGIYDFSWLESAHLVDMNDTSPVPEAWNLQAVRGVKRSSQPGRPRNIAVMSEANGVLTVRLEYVPSTAVWGATLNYQAKAPVKTDLADSWAPFPDELGYVYRQAFLARCYRFLNHARADAEELRALAMIQKAQSGDDREDSNQYVSPERSIMDGGYGW